MAIDDIFRRATNRQRRQDGWLPEETCTFFLGGGVSCSSLMTKRLMWFISDCVVELPYLSRYVTSEMITSSTYFQWLHVGRTRSIKVPRKSMGPNLVPFGTPALLLAHSETDSPRLTRCLWLDRQLHIHAWICSRLVVVEAFEPLD